ncbi:MAG: hypothetical protein AABY22_22750, partial [Nanoarchaeota archaeon]
MGFTIHELRGIIYGINASWKLKADTELEYNGIFDMSGDNANKILSEIISSAEIGVYEAALKYPKVNKEVLSHVFNKYLISTTPIRIKSTRNNISGVKKNILITLYSSEAFVIGNIQDEEYIREDMEPLDGGYWGIITSQRVLLPELLIELFSTEDSYVKDLNFFSNRMSSVDYKNLTQGGILEFDGTKFKINETEGDGNCGIGETEISLSRVVDGKVVESKDTIIKAFDSAFKTKEYLESVSKNDKSMHTTTTVGGGKLDFSIPQWHYDNEGNQLSFEYKEGAECPYTFYTIEQTIKQAPMKNYFEEFIQAVKDSGLFTDIKGNGITDD